MKSPETYSKSQIILHWLIVVLVFFQFILNDGIVKIWQDRMSGAIENVPSINPHALAGILIFILMGWRLWLRIKRGVPALPESESAASKFVANATHILLYVFILGMPISGAAAWFFGLELSAQVHATAKFALIPLIALHLLAALAHHFWFKTNVLKRMLGMS